MLQISPADRTMNRTERKQVLQLRPFLDKLESRRLMSVEVPGARFARELVHEKSELASQLAGGDLTDFAQGLAAHPRIAADLGLGALSQRFASAWDSPSVMVGPRTWSAS